MLITRNNQEEPSIDYSKSFVPVTGLGSLSIVAISPLNAIQFDVTSACLHRTFNKEI